ncbi:hypothetical protein HZB78_03255 [Candidatus Collierbacteria bacterium]|nr:hypothetical protein [Candidatus Collierbacteria bacterium]
MSDIQTTIELTNPQKLIEAEKENMQAYIEFNPNRKLYPDLTPQQIRAFQSGTLDQREIVDKYENHNPYKLEKFTGLITTSKTMLNSKTGQEELLSALDYLEGDLRERLEVGESLSQIQVETLQDLLKQTLEAIG